MQHVGHPAGRAPGYVHGAAVPASVDGVPPVGLRVLGPLSAVVGGRPVNLGGPRQRGVLAQLLVARGEVVPADRLIEDLWRGSPPAKAAASLQAYISNLRRLLEPARGPREPARLLVSRAPGYALLLPAVGSVDAWDFERLLRDARDAAPSGVRTLQPPASRLVSDGLALWQGPAYAEFADEPWAAAEIARLGELRLLARELVITLALADGHPGSGVAAARVLVDEHPLREEGWRLLALSLWGAGRQAEALEALRRARSVLLAELGLDPGPALAELESAILHQRTELLGAPPSPVPLPAPRATAHCGDGAPAPLFVGREAELLTLREAAEAALGGLTVALVTGEAGAGKSTLLGRVRHELVQAGWLVASGRCPETEGAPPAWAWTEALRELAAQAPPDAQAANGLSPLLTERNLTERQDALAGRFHLHLTVGRWLRQTAERTPVAVLLDDLHAADPETRALLADLATGPAAPGVLLVLAHRPGEGELTDTLALLARRSPCRVPLGGLGEAEAERLIGSVSGTAVDRATVRALTERTGGNPFYLSESAKLLAGEGALVAVQQVPQGVRDILRRRFDRLPAATVEALRLAAVVGREAEVELLLRASDSGEDALLDALEAALAGGLLTEPRPGAVRFTHALVRDTLYADLSGLRRTRLHGRVAEALRSLHPDRLAALAHHYTQAASSSTAELAVDHCIRAAEAAERRYAHETCAALLQQALDSLERAPEGEDDRLARRIALLGALLRAQVRSGAITAATTTKATAVRLAAESGREDLLIEAWIAWTEPSPWVTHPYGSYDQSAVDALTTLLRRPDLPPATRCRLLDALTYELDCTGNPAAWDAATEAVAIARAEGDPRLLALALTAQARAHDYELEVHLRAEIATELGTLAREHDLPAYRWYAEHLAATAAAVRADLPALRGHLRAAGEIAERYGLAEAIDVGLCHEAMLALAAGRIDEAERLYGRAIGGLRSRHSVHADGMQALTGVVIALQRGTITQELTLIQAAHVSYGSLAADLLALVLARHGRAAEARAALAERRTVQPDYYRSFFLVLRAMTVITLDERAEAAELLEELRPLSGMVAGVASASIALRPVAMALGELARYLGRPAEAAGHFVQAVAVARRWEAPHWEAEAHRALADLDREARTALGSA